MDLSEASLLPEGTINFFVPITLHHRIRVAVHLSLEGTDLEFIREIEGLGYEDWNEDKRSHLECVLPTTPFMLSHMLFDWLHDEVQAQKVADFIGQIDGMSFQVTLPDLLDPSLAEIA